MKAKQEHKKLFQELEQWSLHKDAFSINDFLKEKGISISEFDLIANSSKKFMKIWEMAGSRAWENLKEALFTKSIPRSRIAEYIKELDAFQDENPEKLMRSLEEGQAQMELYLTAIGDSESLRKYGRLGKIDDLEALMRCGLNRGMITQETYEEIMTVSDENEDEGDYLCEESSFEVDSMGLTLPKNFELELV